MNGLPTRVTRQCVQHGDGLGRRRLLGHVLGGPGTQVLAGRVGARGERDERDRHLAGVRVRTTHRLRGGDRRVCQQHVLDDRRVDVVTAADDQVLGPADQVDEAVRVDPGQVPGVQPAVAQLAQPVQHRPVGSAAGDVAGEHARPADGQHPDLTGRQLDPLTVGADLHGLHLLVGQALADGPGTRMVGEAQCADAGGLGQAVAFDQPDAGCGFEAVPDRLRQR